MGDVRFARHLDSLTGSSDPARELRRMEDDAVIEALAAAARVRDPYLTNVIASEAENRIVRVRAVMNGLSEGVIALDHAGNVTFANRAALAALGHGRGGLDRAPLASLLPPGADAKGVLKRLAERCEEDEDVVLLRVDGTTFEAQCRPARLLRDDVDLGLVVVFSDVSELRERERRDRRRTALYAALLDALGDLGVSVVVGDGERIVHANDRTVALLGYSIEELKALPSVVALAEASELPRVQAAFAGMDTTSELSPPVVVPLRSKDGRRRLVDVRLRTLVVDGEPFFVAFLGAPAASPDGAPARDAL